MDGPIRVLLVDDQPLIRAALALLLNAESDIEVVSQATDGARAVEEALRVAPDVVVMDVRMPGMDGVEATSRLTADSVKGDPDHLVKVLILTTYHADEIVYAALRAGASGFLLKDAAPSDLAAAVRHVASGEAWLDPPVARRLLSEFAARPDLTIPSPEQMQRLTPREREVLVLAAHGLSNTEIAERLVVGEATIKTHVGRVLMKLGLRDRAQAVAMAYQTGLVKPGEASS
jgi:DNA-binding NarL/FixJ family response regulator